MAVSDERIADIRAHLGTLPRHEYWWDLRNMVDAYDTARAALSEVRELVKYLSAPPYLVKVGSQYRQCFFCDEIEREGGGLSHAPDCLVLRARAWLAAHDAVKGDQP